MKIPTMHLPSPPTSRPGPARCAPDSQTRFDQAMAAGPEVRASGEQRKTERSQASSTAKDPDKTTLPRNTQSDLVNATFKRLAEADKKPVDSTDCAKQRNTRQQAEGDSKDAQADDSSPALPNTPLLVLNPALPAHEQPRATPAEVRSLDAPGASAKSVVHERPRSTSDKAQPPRVDDNGADDVKGAQPDGNSPAVARPPVAVLNQQQAHTTLTKGHTHSAAEATAKGAEIDATRGPHAAKKQQHLITPAASTQAQESPHPEHARQPGLPASAVLIPPMPTHAKRSATHAVDGPAGRSVTPGAAPTRQNADNVHREPKHPVGKDHESKPTSLSPAEPAPVGQLQTPGDRLLATVHSTAPHAPLARDLEQLCSALKAHIYSAAGQSKDGTLLRVTLPNLGAVEVHLSKVHGCLQLEIQSSAGSLQTLQLARGELLERLHKLDPQLQVSLAFSNSQDQQQGSRQRRNLYEEWEAEE